MGCKNCKIVCDDEELATISCGEDGVHIKMTEKGKEMHKKMHKGCCE
jgi:hypothetical protein